MDAMVSLNERLAKMVYEFEQDNRKREAKVAEANPLAHKLSRVMDKTSYHYILAGKDGWGRRVWFCWSCHRNVAGFFLGWREVRSKSGLRKRDHWLSRRTRKRVEEIAERRAAAYQRMRTLSPIDPPLPPKD